MAATPEGRVKARIKKYLQDHPAKPWYFMPVPGGYGTNGVPDFIICYRGKFLAVETKAPGKERNTTALQDMQIDRIRRAKGSAIVTSTLEELKLVLSLLDKELDASPSTI